MLPNSCTKASKPSGSGKDGSHLDIGEKWEKLDQDSVVRTHLKKINQHNPSLAHSPPLADMTLIMKDVLQFDPSGKVAYRNTTWNDPPPQFYVLYAAECKKIYDICNNVADIEMKSEDMSIKVKKSGTPTILKSLDDKISRWWPYGVGSRDEAAILERATKFLDRYLFHFSDPELMYFIAASRRATKLCTTNRKHPSTHTLVEAFHSDLCFIRVIWMILIYGPGRLKQCRKNSKLRKAVETTYPGWDFNRHWFPSRSEESTWTALAGWTGKRPLLEVDCEGPFIKVPRTVPKPGQSSKQTPQMKKKNKVEVKEKEKEDALIDLNTNESAMEMDAAEVVDEDINDDIEAESVHIEDLVDELDKVRMRMDIHKERIEAMAPVTQQVVCWAPMMEELMQERQRNKSEMEAADNANRGQLEEIGKQITCLTERYNQLTEELEKMPSGESMIGIKAEIKDLQGRMDEIELNKEMERPQSGIEASHSGVVHDQPASIEIFSHFMTKETDRASREAVLEHRVKDLEQRVEYLTRRLEQPPPPPPHGTAYGMADMQRLGSPMTQASWSPSPSFNNPTTVYGGNHSLTGLGHGSSGWNQPRMWTTSGDHSHPPQLMNPMNQASDYQAWAAKRKRDDGH